MKRSREPDDDLGLHTESGAISSEAQPSAAKIAGYDSTATDQDDDDDNDDSGNEHTAVAMKCSLPPHRDSITFNSYSDYETHYATFHTNRCLECHKNFPTGHLLTVHIEECHDPLVRLKREKGEHTYSCFVEGCERKCLTHQKRRMHMIDKHMYPKNFFFAVTRDGIDNRTSLLADGHHRRRSSTASLAKDTRRRANTLDKAQKEAAAESNAESNIAGQSKDTDMAELTGAMSSLHFVPQSVRFGRGRAGFAKS